MKSFTVFDPVTGAVLRSGVCGESDVDAQAGAMESVMEGRASLSDEYVRNGIIISKPVKPDDYHEFNYITGQWVLAPDAASRMATDTLAAFTQATQRHLDDVARSIGYDSIFTACTYADEPAVAKFQREGRALRTWRSYVWDHCWKVLGEVESHTRSVPTEHELIAELPLLVLP